MAGTVEGQVNRGGLDILNGYRGAWYLGIGMGSGGIAVSICFILFGALKSKEEGAKRGNEIIRLTEEELQSPAEEV